MTRLCCFAIFFLVVAIANWPYAYINAYSDSMGVIDPQLSNHTTQKTFTLAGWPCEFYLESMISAEQKATSFQWTGLVRCVIFWSFFPVLYVVGEKLRRWSILHLQDSDDEVDDRKSHTSQSSGTQSKEKSRDDQASGTFRMRLWEMFVLTALVAGTLSYWLFLCRRGAYDKILAQEIRSEGGFAIRTVMLPRFVTHVLPYVGNEPFLRLSFVQLKNPTDELVSKVFERPYLSSLGLSGGNYSFRNLNRLSTNPLLREVAIVQRQVDSEAISFIQSLPFIRILNLKQTDITAKDLKAIGQPQLEELNLIQTNVRLSELGTPAFSQSLRALRLPLPPNGTGDSLLLEGWPNLVTLSCDDNEKPINSEPVSIVLRNLPNLKTIELDALQLFDIDVETVPNLLDIVPAFYRWQERTTSSQIVPSSIWPRRLRLKDVPKLTEFSFFPMNIESIAIDNSQMQVNLNAYNKSAFRIGEPGNSFTNRVGDTERGFLNASDIPLRTRQKWIDDLSSCAIASLDLELVPLHDVKLNKLKENRSIRNLMLGKSGIVQSQLAAMEEMHQLEELSLLGIFVDDRTIESLLRSLPKLRRLVCEPVGVKNVQVKNKSEIESLFIRPTRKMRESILMGWEDYSGPSIAYDLPLNIIRLESLSIANATKLQDNFISKVPTAHVHIAGSPALKGLSFQHPLPSDAVIQDVRDLVFFAAGGPTCNDAIVNEVLNCKSLKSLTLAFTDLKSATLQRIANLTELESLTMTGSKIDNEFLGSLSKLQKLRKLRLNGTSLDERVDLSALANLKRLEVLELGDWNLKPGAIETIAANHPRLKELSIVRGPLSENSMRKIASLQELDTLELSHCNIDDEMAKAFVETPPMRLRRLFLSSSILGEKGEDLLGSSLKNILFGLTPRQRNYDFSFEIDPMRFSSN